MVDDLSSVIGKIWMHQGAFRRDAAGAVICECLLRKEEAKVHSVKIKGSVP